MSPILGGMAAVDGPLPVGDVAAAGLGAVVLVYGDDAVRWGFEKFRLLNAEGVHPSTPTGQEGHEIQVKPGTNTPASIGGRDYTGHSLDRMQGRGIPPSVVEDTIVNGSSSAGKRPGTIEYRSKENRVRVITNDQGGVVTVIPR